MTALDELKDALESSPDFTPVALDLDRVMATGGRIRRRRRAATFGLSGAAAVALLIVIGQLADLSPATTSTTSGAAAYPAASGMVPSALNSSAPGILGTVVKTGRYVDGRQWILYVETVDPDKLNRNMTLVLGRTKSGYINDFTRDVAAEDTSNTRMAPGFHAVRNAAVIEAGTIPTFGYYAGAPDRISARNTATGKTVNAHLTAWSGFGATEKAQIFWFDFAEGQTPPKLTDLTAYDKNGNKLAAQG